MRARTRATWVSRNERSIWCLDFSNYSSDRDGLIAEIAASQIVICQQPEDSLLVAIDLYHVTMTSELKEFLRICASPKRSSIHKLAVVHVSPLERLWYQTVNRIAWPKNTRFFDDYEQAKDWLVGEKF